MSHKPLQFGLLTMFALTTGVAVVAAFPVALVIACLAFTVVGGILEARRRS